MVGDACHASYQARIVESLACKAYEATPAAATGTLRVLADPTRLRLLEELVAGEQCVTLLTDALGLRQPRISHHLGILRRAGLVQARRAGKKIYYRLIRRWHLGSRHPHLDLGSLQLEFKR